MKKMLIISIIGVLFFSSFGAVYGQIESKNNLINDAIYFSNPTLYENMEYVEIDLEEKTSFILDPGKPRLPVVTKVYTFPFGTNIESVDVKLSYDSTIKLSKKISPNLERTILTKSENIVKTKIDEVIYKSSNFYPLEKFDYDIGGGRKDGDNVIYLKINCYPIQYSPQKNIISVASKADISIKYEQISNAIERTDEYDLVVITPSDFSEALQPLIDHKNSMGLSTIIKTLEDIYSEYPGRDEPEQIKYFIFDAFEQMNISYIMLVGSIDNFPIRYTEVKVWEPYDIPTDLYYADIIDEHGDFCSWDSNENNIFGEYDWDIGIIDDVDLYPDIGIGRIACSNIDELEIVVNKIINYETNTYGSSWFDKIITMGGDTFPGYNVIEGEVVSQQVIDAMPDFEPIKLWTSLGTFRPVNINSNINSGAGFVSYSGHGYAQGFGTSPPNVDRRIQYYSYRLFGMRNQEKLPIFFFDACSTTNLDFNWAGFEEFYPPLVKIIKIVKGSSYDPLELYPCFAWMLIKKENGGAIATVGSTRVAYTWVDQSGAHGGASYLNVGFFEGYEPGIFVSDMLIYSQNKYLNYVGMDCFTLEEFNLLGDPTLKVGGYL